MGFLDSRNRTPVDAAYIDPIRSEISSKVDAYARALAPDSDRQAFEQARRDAGHVFVQRGDIDIEKIKKSKYYRHILDRPKGNTASQSISMTASDASLLNLNGSSSKEKQQAKASELAAQHEKLSARVSKLMMQTKLTSIYGSKAQKSNNVSDKKLLNSENGKSVECVEVENDEEAKPHHNILRSKRRHKEFTSPVCEIVKSPSPSSNEEANVDTSGNGFVTARAKLEMDARQKHGLAASSNSSVSLQTDNNLSGNMRNYGMRSGGLSRRGLRGNFVPPIRSNGGNAGNMTTRISGKCDDSLEDSTRRCLEMLCGPDGELSEKLRNLEPRLLEHVSNEIMDKDPNVRWNDIAGLDHAKKCVTEMVIWPLLRPDIFRGCRSPGRGLLLFGPPGTGKTMIGKAIAGEAKATFFYISASSLTSKWIGEGEKLVRALFGVASCRQPAVIFVDEIDSLLSQRKSEGEHESSRRLKTQFLIEMEGFDSGNEQILLIGATNRPQELDEAARRRLTKRLYIPLPSSEARAWIIRNLLEKDGLFKLSEDDTRSICKLTEGYSGSDMKNLVKDASMGPLREALRQGIEITQLKKEDMRPVTLQDFEDALQEVRPSVSTKELGTYEEWNKQFGSLSV